MFEPVQEAVAKGNLRQNPGMYVGAETRNEVEIPIVTGQCEEGVKLRAQPVSCGKILRMVAFAHVEGASVYLNALDHLRDENVGVRVAVSVRVGREVVRNKVTSYLDIERNGFTVVPRHAWCEILRSFDSA